MRVPLGGAVTAPPIAFAAELRDSLGARRPWIPSKYFYDDRGSRLFDAITKLPEYYLTRTEEAILARHAGDAVALLRPSELIELGSGAGRKVRLLLDAMARGGALRRCILLDINELYLRRAVAALAAAYPRAEVKGVLADFLEELPEVARAGRRMIAFLGSTIGNLAPRDVPPFLRRVRRHLLPGEALLLGVDLVKDVKRLEAAYNDAAGVTAEFNLNILRVANERTGTDFDLGAFDHVAFYDGRRAWIEMRLRARRATSFRIPLTATRRRLRRGDEIRTEISCKYTRRSLLARVRGTGLELTRWYTDEEQLFALAVLAAPPSS
jgi:L-histidine N-alpha-methyltransferase